jgi:DNA repair photolyase
MIQVLHLFGYLPNMLELSMTECSQGCDYCYAKMWKRESVPIEKIVNNILHHEAKQEGLLPFLLQKRSPITISNRTDVMCAPDWRERLSAIKKMGFPIYLETKLNKDYKDLAQILDKNTDTIYQTITGWNNKHEEPNLLSAEEKIEAARWLNKQGFHHTLAVNPYLPDKVTVDEIKRMLDYIKPHSFVMRNYHRTSRSIYKHLYMKEWQDEETYPAREAIRAYCLEKGVYHDIDYWAEHPYPEFNGRLESNEWMFKGNHFVFQAFIVYLLEYAMNNEIEGPNIQFDDFLYFFDKQVSYFKDCVIKANDYSMAAGKSSFKWQKERFDIVYFLREFWNYGKLEGLLRTYRVSQDSQPFNAEGNLIYFFDPPAKADILPKGGKP